MGPAITLSAKASLDPGHVDAHAITTELESNDVTIKINYGESTKASNKVVGPPCIEPSYSSKICIMLCSCPYHDEAMVCGNHTTDPTS